MKRAFTLMELLVVIAMIAMLLAAVGASVYRVQLRSRIARAEAEANEMTNAIRAYENYVDTGLKEMNDVDADESSLDFLLGNATDRGGNKIPVLFNATVVGGKIRDPWGTPYRVRVNGMNGEEANDDVARSMTTGVYVPNRYNSRAEVQ